MSGTPAQVLLAELRALGIELEVASDRLRYRPLDAVHPELRERMSARKAELIVLLSALELGVGDVTVGVDL